MSHILLGVNIDHVATLRNARGTRYPDPVHAAEIAERAGADGITALLCQKMWNATITPYCVYHLVNNHRLQH